MGDRGYGKRDNVIALAGMQAAALLRFSPDHCRLEQADGSLFEVCRWLDGLEEVIQIGEQEGSCVQGTERVKVRVLALRLPPEEAEKARVAGARPCSTQAASCAARDITLGWLDPVDFARWMHTTFPLRNCSGCIVNRWQIELLIKRMKQFLLLVRLRSRHPAAVRAILLAALVAWALQEGKGKHICAC